MEIYPIAIRTAAKISLLHRQSFTTSVFEEIEKITGIEKYQLSIYKTYVMPKDRIAFIEKYRSYEPGGMTIEITHATNDATSFPEIDINKISAKILEAIKKHTDIGIVSIVIGGSLYLDVDVDNFITLAVGREVLTEDK